MAFGNKAVKKGQEMQNSGVAVSLATTSFAANPLATLPGAIFSVWHNISGSVFAGIRRSKCRKK